MLVEFISEEPSMPVHGVPKMTVENMDIGNVASNESDTYVKSKEADELKVDNGDSNMGTDKMDVDKTDPLIGNYFSIVSLSIIRY